MVKIFMVIGTMGVFFLNGCVVNEEQVKKDESNYIPSEQTTWEPEQK
ncbi:hypothetical protein [Helicobacter sp. 13S00477-4]|nr:hypothetical protein [Helicobacter sp. 13S00477-4]